MQDKQNREDKPKTRSAGAGEQNMDAAEGDLETIEESLRIHEKKGDLKGTSPEKPSGKKG